MLHLHLESFRKRPALFHLTEEHWAAAAKRHRVLAKRLHVTIGWDGDILDEALKTADVMINSSPPKDRLQERAPRLKWIQTTGAGVDVLAPLSWLPQNIVLTNNSGAHGAKAEDSCTMALLMLNARLPQILGNQRNRVWQQIFSTPIAGKTALIVGFGDLGQAAGRAAKKLGLKIIAVTRSGKAGRPADIALPSSRIERVLPKADFVVVTTPLTAETRGLLNRARLNLLKPEAGIINIGRSPVIDYAALRDKLEKNEISGAVLDVFDQEPLPADSPLWTAPNLVITPHISCDDPRYIDMLFDRWFENFERFLAGRRLNNIVDRKLGY
ncbi:MAG: D-2-hydroxyacid dehydrogenase [Pseudomonadota bacterium]